MAKQNVAHAYNGIISLKKAGHCDTCHKWMNLEAIVLSEMSQSQRTKSVGLHLAEKPRVVKYTGTESGIEMTRS